MSTPSQHPVTFGVIFGNRGFFPDHLAKSGREEMIAVLSKAGHSIECPRNMLLLALENATFRLESG
jgi:L-fucose isomerase-like protein